MIVNAARNGIISVIKIITEQSAAAHININEECAVRNGGSTRAIEEWGGSAFRMAETSGMDKRSVR